MVSPLTLQRHELGNSVHATFLYPTSFLPADTRYIVSGTGIYIPGIMKLAHSTKLSTSSLTQQSSVSLSRRIALSSASGVGVPRTSSRLRCDRLLLRLCFCSGSYYVLYKHQRRRQLAARGHCHSSTAISAFTRRPAAEGKLLLRVYLTRPVVGHRVAQATQQSAFTLEAAKTQPNVCSKRRDSESWTDIERQNQRLRHEI